jgi:hypothetical protein
MSYDPFRRALRTFGQAFLAVLLGSLAGVIPSQGAFWAVMQSATLAGAIAVLALAQNMLEESGALPAVLKDPPQPPR